MRTFVIGLACVAALSAETATITVCASGCDYTTVQAAVNAATGGEVIEIAAGETFEGNLVLPYKASTAWITLRSSRAAELPADGNRVNPADHAALMPHIQTPNMYSALSATVGDYPQYSPNGVNTTNDTIEEYRAAAWGDGTPITFGANPPAPLVRGTVYYMRDRSGNTFSLAHTLGGAAIDLTSQGSGGPIAKAQNAHHYRLIGLDFVAKTGSNPYYLAIIGLLEPNADTVPHHIEFERCLFRGQPVENGPQFGLVLNGSHLSVKDSWIGHIKRTGGLESKGIWMGNTPGPVLIQNNFVSAASLGIFTAGQAAPILNQINSNITIRGNHIAKAGYMLYKEGSGAPTGPCYYAQGSGAFYRDTSPSPNTCANGACYVCGADEVWHQDLTASYRSGHYLPKGGMEFKDGENLLIENNVIEGVFAGPDTGNAPCISFVQLNQGGLYHYIAHAMVRQNWCKDVWTGTLAVVDDGSDFPTRNHDVTFINNLITGAGRFPEMSMHANAYTFDVKPIAVRNGAKDIVFDHNTWRYEDYSGGAALWMINSHPSGGAMDGSYFRNNIVQAGPYCKYIEADTTCGATGLGKFLDSSTTDRIANIVTYDEVEGRCSTYRSCPQVSNWAAPTLDQVKFVSSTNHRLDPTSPYSASCTSGCAFAGTDGKDLGADIDLVEASVSGALSGIYNAVGTPTVQTVCASGCDQTNLQTAINNAAAANSGPQIIVLKAGENFDTATGFYLPARSGSYTGWITIRSSKIGELPARTRVSPSDTAKLATLRVTAGGLNPVLYTSGHPSAYWRLEGLEFTPSTTGLGHQGWLVGVGLGTDTGETEPSKVSHHIVLDRCYIHGLAFDNGPKGGLRLNADHVEILNSYISEIKRDDAESHDIVGNSLNGPLLIRNTFHGSGAVSSMFGGAGSASVTIQPRHLMFLGNHYRKTPTHRALRYSGAPLGTSLPGSGVDYQPFWKTDTNAFYLYLSGDWRQATSDGATAGNVCIDGDFWEDTSGPTYYLCSGGTWGVTGSNRTISGGTYSPFTRFWAMNLFELKKVSGGVVEGNLLENCFSPTQQGQGCAAFLFHHVQDQDGPWATIRGVEVRNNLVRRTPQTLLEGSVAHARSGYFTHRRPSLITFENNLVQEGNSPTVMAALNQVVINWNGEYSALAGSYGGVGRISFHRQTIRHNTFANPLNSTRFVSYGLVYSETSGLSGVVVSDNIFESGQADNTAVWLGNQGCSSFASAGGWSSYTFKKNMISRSETFYSNNTPDIYGTADCQSWAWPYKRSGAGIRSSPVGGSISGGVLTVDFGDGNPHGLLSNTRIRLAGWTPSGLNGDYTLPWYHCGTQNPHLPTHQYSLCLPTAETGAVTPGTIEATPGFADYPAQDFRLAANSLYKNWATDGSDPGANQDMVEWATETAESGAGNPYLDFRVRSITSTADGAVIRFTAYSPAACAWTISSTRAFADSLGSVSQSRTGRDGTATVNGLGNSTAHWYRVACDGKHREGEFVTGR